jgi:hypothetical protein
MRRKPHRRFLLCLLAIVGCEHGPSTTTDALDAEYDRQLDESTRQLEVSAKQQEEALRLVKHSAEQAERFDRLLERWERQADRQDKLLDRQEFSETPTETTR